MIPVSLKISNFTSYGPSVPTLDFSKFHLAAISGQNGAGKSSLLDSITWCLWGTSRMGDSSDQLIRLGQKEMTVEFSFELDGHIFTVKRDRALRGTSGSTSLELLSDSHNLTEGTIKATQQKIRDLLHLSYETFTNSAFLRQGHADEFTTKGPADRKRILADILGLSHFDELEEKAKEKAKEVHSKLQLLEYQLLEIEAELSQKEERGKALSSAEIAAQKAEKELADIEKLVREIEKEKGVINAQYQALLEKQQRLLAAQKELEDLKIQISLKEKGQEEYQKILGLREKIKKDWTKLQKLQKEKKALDIKRGELIQVKDELANIQKILVSRKEKRDKAVSTLEVEIKRLQTISEQKQQEIDHLLSHKDTCPTCGQVIGQEKNREIVKANKQVIKENNLKKEELRATLKKYLNFIFPEELKAQEKERKVTSLEADVRGYPALTQEINSLSPVENLYLKLKEADTAVKTHREAIMDLEKVYQGRQKQVIEENDEIKDLDSHEQRLRGTETRLLAQETVKKELAQKSQQFRAAVGEARQLVSRTTQLETLHKEKGSEKARLQSEKEAYEELALAFGKKGIQAMIIETAIPEIEDEANRILNKLTEGRMRVHLETQRETKAGTTTETLDIVISDEMGERVYEAYSGGEQFRVNFAIRLALSKLLTHRAGAKLQFLVIDEGFGTQDAEGRSRVVEALDAIKDDFEKILVITHLEELKEEFPVRIEVSKGPAGSIFEVVGA